MKKSILSLAVLCVFTAFSSGRLMSAESNTHRPSGKFSRFTLAPVTYRNLKANPGYIVIKDLVTGITYSASLPSTGTGLPVSTGIMLEIGHHLEVTLYSGNDESSLRFQEQTQTGISVLHIPSVAFLPSPSMIVIQ